MASLNPWDIPASNIIPLPSARAKQEPGDVAPPRSAPVATRRYLRHLDADTLARLLDGTDRHAEPEVVRRQREFSIRTPFAERMVAFFRRSARTVGLACMALSAAAVVYFIAELARLAF